MEKLRKKHVSIIFSQAEAAKDQLKAGTFDLTKVLETIIDPYVRNKKKLEQFGTEVVGSYTKDNFNLIGERLQDDFQQRDDKTISSVLPDRLGSVFVTYCATMVRQYPNKSDLQ